jgi:hypothetical protein
MSSNSFEFNISDLIKDANCVFKKLNNSITTGKGLREIRGEPCNILNVFIYDEQDDTKAIKVAYTEFKHRTAFYINIVRFLIIPILVIRK